MGRSLGRQTQRLDQTRSAIGLISDLGGAAVTLSMIAAALVGVVSVLVGLADDRPNAVYGGGGLVVGVGVGALLTQVSLARRRPLTVEAQRGYEWVEAVYTYTIDGADRHEHSQAVDITIRATRDDVDLFSNQYRWSGEGADNKPVVTSKGHALVGALRRSLGWRHYLVSLNPVLGRGDTTTISITQRFNDEKERFEPFLAKAVHENMELLVLRVQLPPLLRPLRVWRVAREGTGPTARVIERANVEAADDGRSAVIEWQVPRPGQGLNYELYWDYGDGQGVYDVAL